MQKILGVVFMCFFSIAQSGCGFPSPSAMKGALSECMHGGKECFEKKLGAPVDTGWTKSGYYYMQWYGTGMSESAHPQGTGYGDTGGMQSIPCTLEINLKGNDVVKYKFTGPCKDYELRY